VAPGLIKPPRSQRLPDIVTIEEAERIFMATRALSYRVFFFTLYSLGLRLGEGLRLTVADIDGSRARVHIRDAKGNKDRLVPLPTATYRLLRRLWQRHRNPVLLFPNRHGGLSGAHAASTPLDRGDVQKALRAVVESCGLKKTFRPTAFGTMPRSELCRPMQLVAPQVRNQLSFGRQMAFSVGIVSIVAAYSPLRKANS